MRGTSSPHDLCPQGRLDLPGPPVRCGCTYKARDHWCLLLHGFPESGRAWRLQLPALAAAGYRAAAPDLRGYGGSVKPVPVEAYRMLNHGADKVAIVHGLRRGNGDRRRPRLGLADRRRVGADAADLFTALGLLGVPYTPRGDVPAERGVRADGRRGGVLRLVFPAAGPGRGRDRRGPSRVATWLRRRAGWRHASAASLVHRAARGSATRSVPEGRLPAAVASRGRTRRARGGSDRGRFSGFPEPLRQLRPGLGGPRRLRRAGIHSNRRPTSSEPRTRAPCGSPTPWPARPSGSPTLRGADGGFVSQASTGAKSLIEARDCRALHGGGRRFDPVILHRVTAREARPPAGFLVLGRGGP